MNLNKMYPSISGSPTSKITTVLLTSTTSIPVENGSFFPFTPGVGGVASIFKSEGDRLFGPFETIHFTSVIGNNLVGVTRGFDGTTALNWDNGSIIARVSISADHMAVVDNIKQLKDAIENFNGSCSVVNLLSNIGIPPIVDFDSVLSGSIYWNLDKVDGEVNTWTGYLYGEWNDGDDSDFDKIFTDFDAYNDTLIIKGCLWYENTSSRGSVPFNTVLNAQYVGDGVEFVDSIETRPTTSTIEFWSVFGDDGYNFIEIVVEDFKRNYGDEEKVALCITDFQVLKGRV